MKSLKRMFSSIKKIGERTCNECESIVPIYKQGGEEISYCLNCENIKLKNEMEEYRRGREKRAVNRLVEKYEIQPYQKSVTFNDYVPSTQSQRNAKEIAMSFHDLEQTTLFIQGKPGVGKTHLSYCISEFWKEQDKTSLFVDVPNLMNTIKSSYNRNSYFSEEELMRLINDVDLLVLDDIGAEYAKDNDGLENWVSEQLIKIINFREGKRNVYTTNYDSKTLQKKYGMLSGRIISRMMNNAKFLKIDGHDYRLKGLV